MAKGLLPDDHPQSAATARSFAIGQADVVMVIGARLNWLLGHGRSPHWSATAQFVQVDISPTEIDSNRAIAAPVVGDIKSAMSRSPGGPQTRAGEAERRSGFDVSPKHKQKNIEAHGG